MASVDAALRALRGRNRAVCCRCACAHGPPSPTSRLIQKCGFGSAYRAHRRAVDTQSPPPFPPQSGNTDKRPHPPAMGGQAGERHDQRQTACLLARPTARPWGPRAGPACLPSWQAILVTHPPPPPMPRQGKPLSGGSPPRSRAQRRPFQHPSPSWRRISALKERTATSPGGPGCGSWRKRYASAATAEAGASRPKASWQARSRQA